MRFGQCAGNGGERRQMPSMRLGPRRTCVDHAEQGRWRKRLAQAARRAKFLSHSREVGTGRVRNREGGSGNRDQRHARRVLVEHPDRFETAHIGHEDIDNHQIERYLLEGGETLGSTIGDRDPKTIPLEPSANGQTDMRIVIDYQNAAHSNSPHVLVRSTDPRIDRTMIFAAANQRVILISAAKSLIRLPCSVYRPCSAADRLAQLTHHIMSFSPVTSHTSSTRVKRDRSRSSPFGQSVYAF